jgi:hypothetical protein
MTTVSHDFLKKSAVEVLCGGTDECPLADLDMSADIFCPLLGRSCPLARMLAQAAPFPQQDEVNAR